MDRNIEGYEKEIGITVTKTELVREISKTNE
jgi:hypothetical protein